MRTELTPQTSIKTLSTLHIRQVPSVSRVNRFRTKSTTVHFERLRVRSRRIRLMWTSCEKMLAEHRSEMCNNMWRDRGCDVLPSTPLQAQSCSRVWYLCQRLVSERRTWCSSAQERVSGAERQLDISDGTERGRRWPPWWLLTYAIPIARSSRPYIRHLTIRRMPRVRKANVKDMRLMFQSHA